VRTLEGWHAHPPAAGLGTRWVDADGARPAAIEAHHTSLQKQTTTKGPSVHCAAGAVRCTLSTPAAHLPRGGAHHGASSHVLPAPATRRQLHTPPEHSVRQILRAPPCPRASDQEASSHGEHQKCNAMGMKREACAVSRALDETNLILGRRLLPPPILHGIHGSHSIGRDQGLQLLAPPWV
jgi:hypothetical protein